MLERRVFKFSSLRSIRGKLFCLRIGIGVVMAFSLGLFCYHIMTRSMEDLREEDMERDAQILVELLSRKVDEQKRDLIEISKADPVKKYFMNYSLNMIQAYLEKLQVSFASIGLIDDGGAMDINFVRGKAILNSIDLKNDPDYVLALQAKPGQTVISLPRFFDFLDEYALVYDCMFTDFFHKRLSFVRATFPLAKFSEVLAKAKVETINNIFIVSTAGQVIYSSQHKEDLGQDITKVGGLLGRLWAKKQPFGEDYFNGDSFKYKRDVIPELGWQLLITADLALWNKPIAKLRTQIIFFALFMVVLGEIFSRMIGLKITEPITRLNRLAQAIVHSGRLSDRVVWESMDELGELARSVNQMLDRLEESHDQLLAEKQFVDNVLASMVDGMAICDTNGVIIKTNEALPYMLGYDQDALFCMLAVSILPPEAVVTREIPGLPTMGVNSAQSPLVPDLVQALLVSAEGRNQQIALDTEHPYLRLADTLAPMKGGDKLPVACTISMVRDLAGGPNGFLVILTDIRDRKLLEKSKEKAESRLRDTQEELLKTEKMAVVGQMSGMVAHEVLNPISAVKVRVDLGIPKAQELAKVIEVLVRIITDWRTEEKNGTFANYFAASGKKDLAILAKIGDTLVKRHADRISDLDFLDRQIQRIIKIIDNLREMSRQEQTIEKVALTKLLDEVIDDLGDGLKKRQIELRREYRTTPVVKVDYMEVYSIFSNLIKNAMQAIEKQPPEVERSITVVLDHANEQQALVEISDTGIGMDLSQSDAVFTPGFTSKGRQGTGIGTSFARKLARQFGGDILIKESVPGKGTTFQVLLAMEEKK